MILPLISKVSTYEWYNFWGLDNLFCVHNGHNGHCTTLKINCYTDFESVGWAFESPRGRQSLLMGGILKKFGCVFIQRTQAAANWYM